MATLALDSDQTSVGHVSTSQVAYAQSVVIDGTSTALTSGDVYQALRVPANTCVIAAGIDVLTAGTGTGTVALGDGSLTYVAAAAPTSATQLAVANDVPKAYAAADTLDVTIATANVNAKIRVWAVMVDVDGINNSQIVTFA